jgi:putative ABC transport system ATP-binding protein
MLLDINNVSKTYRTPSQDVHALSGISLTLDVGEFKAVCGPSGCGKSTLLLLAGGLLAPTEGQVQIAGEDPYALSPDERAGFRAENIGFVFQQFHLVPYLTVLENVLVATIGTNLPSASDRALELLKQFGMDHRLNHVPAELSTGERQRTAMARALMNRPKLLLADEPTGNLDSENAEIIMWNLVNFANEGAVLLVTHDSRVLEYVQKVEWIREGRLVPAEEQTQVSQTARET